MDSLKKRLIITNILMITISAALLLFVTVLFALLLSLASPEGYKTVAEIIIATLRNIEEEVESDSSYIMAIWMVSCFVVVVATCIGLSNYFARSVILPLSELKKSAEEVAKGNLNEEVLYSGDIELNELYEAVNIIRKNLKTSADMKLKEQEERNLLLANLSHDMRTPVTSIKGYIEGIKDGIADTEEKREKYLDTIYSKAIVLEKLLDNMTQYSELELGRMQYAFEFINMRKFLTKSAENYEQEIEGRQREVSFNWNFSAFGDYQIVGDKDKLKRVFDNLISNAIKYSKEQGKIIISFLGETDGKGLYVIVSDNGRGINKEDAEKVFEGFYRGDAARSNIKGNGLGLAICKQIVEAHKGKIWIKTEEDIGTEVFIYMPIREK